MARKSKQDWLNKGEKLLEREGEGALTIQRLAGALKLTKGSFYHHFNNREDFSRALLTGWEDRATAAVIDLVNREEDPVDRIRTIMKITTRSGEEKLEVAIRAWALRDPLAHAFQERVDQLRRDYTIKLAQDILGQNETAKQLGTVIFGLYVGAQQMIPPIEGEQLSALYNLLAKQFHIYNEEDAS